MTTQTKGCGEIVTWTVRGAFIARDKLIAELRAVGITANVKVTRPATYLHRALEQCVADSLVRKIGEDATYVAYAAVHEERSLQRNDYSTDVKEAVRLNKTTGDLEFKRDTTLTRAIREGMTDSQGALLSHEIGAVLKNTIIADCNGLPLRDTGGVYFVPAVNCGMLDKLEQALSKTPKNRNCVIKVQRLRVYAGAREASDIAAVFAESIMDEANAAADEIREALKDITRARPSTFVRRAQVFKSRLLKIADYESVLQGIKFTEQADKCKRMVKLFTAAEKKCREERAAARSKGVVLDD